MSLCEHRPGRRDGFPEAHTASLRGDVARAVSDRQRLDGVASPEAHVFFHYPGPNL